ncbi:MAG: hypothetical protein AAF940_15770 [Pseudomonadota bacterium]
MIRRALTLACIAGLAGCTINRAPVPYTVMEAGEVQVHSDITLERGTAAAFEDFTSAGEAYGVMYVAPNGGDHYWRVGSFSARDVDHEARVKCAAIIQAACIRYATINPQSVDLDTAIPARIERQLRRAMRRTKTGDFVAIAVMPTGAYGYGFNYDTADEAEARALKECAAEIASEQKTVDADILPTLIDAGLFECRLFQTYRR